MAKWGNYYGLCPLIDQQSLLGVAEDVEVGYVIVTLGKNICIKYRISDQKQIHSWRTKDKFSSPVIYDFDGSKYVAVFNNSYIKIWNDDEENIDKLKKHKFTKQIHTLIQHCKKTFVVFKDGSVSELSDALDNRKQYNNEELDSDGNIVDVLSCQKGEEIYIAILFALQGKTTLKWNKYAGGSFHYKTATVLNKRKSVKLVGQVLCHLAIEGNIQFLTLWSDGYMNAYPLEVPSSEDDAISNPPGNHFAVVQSLSVEHPVSMAPLNQHYIALYGADSSQEGAVLLLYNTQFKVTQSKISFKLFTSGSKLWKVENYLLLGMGQNLAVIPFHLHMERLATLIGSHKESPNESSTESDIDVAIINKIEVVNWDKDDEKETAGEINGVVPEENIPESIRLKTTHLLEQGKSGSAVCSELLPQLMEKKDIEAVLNALDYFVDIPESLIVKLLHFAMSVESKSFKSNVCNESLPDDLQPIARCNFIDKILSLPFSDILLLPHLRRNLDLNFCLLLIFYIQHLLSSEEHCLTNMDGVETEKKLIDWGSVLLDAKYQNIVLSRDENVIELLKKFSDVVNEHLVCLQELNRVYPELEKIRRNDSCNENVHTSSLFYSVEKLSLY